MPLPPSPPSVSATFFNAANKKRTVGTRCVDLVGFDPTSVLSTQRCVELFITVGCGQQNEQKRQLVLPHGSKTQLGAYGTSVKSAVLR